MRLTVLVGTALLAGETYGASLEGAVQFGIAFSNLPGVAAPAIAGRAAVDPFDHFSLGVRGFLVLGGGPDYSVKTNQFRGWAVLSDVRIHTGSWLAPVRIDVGAGAGLGREIAAGGVASELGTFETTRTGLTLAASLAARVRAGAILVGAEASPFYWAGQERLMGTGFSSPNGGLGALLVLSVGCAF